MRFSKTSHYGLCAALEMARLDDDGTVTVAEVAARYDFPEGVLAKVFQQLARAGIAIGTRGVGGGYRLAHVPSELSALDVIDALGSVSANIEDSDDQPSPASSLDRLLQEIDDLVRVTLASTSLETLARR